MPGNGEKSQASHIAVLGGYKENNIARFAVAMGTHFCNDMGGIVYSRDELLTENVLVIEALFGC
jgi:hypothetical protein